MADALSERGGAAVAAAPRGAGARYDRESLDVRTGEEPAWLRERRLQAFELYEDSPLPTTRLEEWRYTDPRLLKWDRVELAPLGGEAPTLELDDELRSKGVLLVDMATAAHERADLLREHLGKALPDTTGKFAALNAAFWSAGVLLYVPRGVRIDDPIRLMRRIEQGGLAYFPRTLIVAGEGSQVAVIEDFGSPDLTHPAFSCGVVEISAAATASVQYVAMQRYGRGVHHLAMQRTIAGRDASVDTLMVNLGASVARVELAASLEGPGSRSDMLGLYFGQGDQHFDHSTRQDHRVAHASSDLLYKGALDGRSRAVFRGLIKVFPKAQRTDAYQTNRNLILSREAEATSLPNLEIEADDVRCSHAATVGQLDREELFYIMSRGVPRHEAERLVVFGFFGEVLERLPIPSLVAELRAAIEEKIG